MNPSGSANWLKRKMTNSNRRQAYLPIFVNKDKRIQHTEFLTRKTRANCTKPITDTYEYNQCLILFTRYSLQFLLATHNTKHIKSKITFQFPSLKFLFFADAVALLMSIHHPFSKAFYFIASYNPTVSAVLY